MSETVLNFSRRVTWPALKLPSARTVLAWSWRAFKVLYRGGYVVAVYAFGFLWLVSASKLPGFHQVSAQFLADLQTLMNMAAGSLGAATHRVIYALAQLPPPAFFLGLAWAASYVIYGIARFGRSRREA